MKIIALTIQMRRTSKKLVTQNISRWKETLSKKLGFSENPTALTLLSKVPPCTIVLVQDRFSKHRPFGLMLSISRFVRTYVCLYICLFNFEVPLNGLFAPTSQSRMSNIFRDSESLGKSNGKKWSHMWTFLFGSGLKSPRKKMCFFCWFCLTKHGGNHASRWIRDFWSKGISLILAYL